jgi:alpha-D-ribose 1-methylphosphonate 5-triphosphate synthase subunit PhnH
MQMHSSMDLYQLIPGFDDSELVAQQNFRAIVKALDNPGRLVKIKNRFPVPGVLNPASAAIFLTLGSDEAPVWADLSWSSPLIEWFQYQCGCSIVTEPCMASLALITKPIAMPPLDHFRIGGEEQSDTSATLIIQVDELFANTISSPTRTRKNETLIRKPIKEPINFWDHWQQQSTFFSPDVDIFLTCDDVMISLPHPIRQEIQP